MTDDVRATRDTQTMSDDTPDDETRERTEATDRPRMRDVDHTHPYTGAPFGDSGVYDRGPDDAASDEDDDDGQGVEDGPSDGGGPEPAVRRVSRARTER
jgi:hypothetical protein